MLSFSEAARNRTTHPCGLGERRYTSKRFCLRPFADGRAHHMPSRNRPSVQAHHSRFPSSKANFGKEQLGTYFRKADASDAPRLGQKGYFPATGSISGKPSTRSAVRLRCDVTLQITIAARPFDTDRDAIAAPLRAYSPAMTATCVSVRLRSSARWKSEPIATAGETGQNRASHITIRNRSCVGVSGVGCLAGLSKVSALDYAPTLLQAIATIRL